MPLPSPRRPRTRAARGTRTTRRRVSTAAAALMLAALAAAAWLHEGASQADVELDDGGVWVTSTSQHLVARLNYPSRQVDGAIRTTSANFDVTQSADHVLVPDTASSTVSAVDPTTVSLSTGTPLTSGAAVSQGADRVIAADPAEGTVRASSVDAVGSLSSAPALIENQPDVVAVAGTDGSVHAVSPKTDTITTVPVRGAGWAEADSESASLTAGTDVAVTAVGGDTIVLERGTGVLHLPGGRTLDLGEAGLTLQQPGPASDTVLVASRTHLMSVNLDGSGSTSLPASEDGEPVDGVAAAPVRLGECAYSAWSGSGQFVRQCAGAVETRHDDRLASSAAPVFRVNRDAIVLNDIAEGTVWLPDDELVLVENWTDVTSQTDETADDKDNSAQTTESQTLPERTEENHAPEAVDDSFGVRPGRSTVLPVLANDSDQDGDVLTAIPGEGAANARVDQAQEGLALRMEVADDAAGTITVPYTADDGRGLSDSAVATVDVHPWDVNTAPEQITTPKIVVSGSASASAGVLSAWQDPDGDTLYLVSAQGEGMDVRTTNEGTVAVRDLTGAPGTRPLTVVVSDGRETTAGTVDVDVQPAEAAEPIANADHVQVVAGTQALFSPLDNDTSPSGEPLSLAGLDDPPAGTTAEINRQAGTVTFTAEAAGTYYLGYDVTAGAAVAKGIVRVDVVAASDSSVPPVPENDTALLREGGSVTIAPLSNDFDPSGGILVLQSASTPADSGVTVTVVDHSLLEITSAGNLPQSVDLEYTVSNGASTATGRVSVVPITSGEAQVPVTAADTAVVRVGDVVTVPVLNNDTSPSGLALSLSDELGTAGDALGTAWVSEDSVRIKAGDVPGRTTLTYTATDTLGQTATGRLDVEVRDRDDAANTAPSPQSLEASTVAGSPVNITVPMDGIDPDGDSVSLVGLNQPPTGGTVQVDSTWLTYTPTDGTTGTDTFTYTVQDRFGAQASATVRVGVAPTSATNTAPTATDDTVVAKPGRTVAVDVLSNDLDADGDNLVLEGTPVCDDDALGVSVRSNRVILNLPATEGVRTVRYIVSDSRGGTDTGTLTVDVRADAPQASPVGVDDYVTVDKVEADGSVTVPVLDNDSDADGSPWDLTLTTDDPSAQVIDGQSIRATVGDQRQFVLYTVTDVDGLTGHAVVVVPARSELRPRLNSSAVPVRIPPDRTSDVDLSSFILSRAGTSLSVTDPSALRTGTGLEAAAVGGNGGALSLTPTTGFTGQTSVTLTVADGTGDDALSSTLTLPVLVESSTNTAPVLTPTQISVAPGEGAVTADLAAMTKDADGDRLSFSASSPSAGFDADLSGSILSVKAADDASIGTTGSTTVAVDDGTNPPVSAEIPLRVVDSTKPLMTTTPVMLVSDGSPVTVDVASLVTNPFPDKPITLSGEPSVTSGQGTVTTSGTTLTISPAAGFTGRLVVGYGVLDATGSAARGVSGTVTVTVAGVPEAPVGVSAEPQGSSAMTVTWSPGADHGAPVTSYTVTEVDGAGSWTCTGSPCLASGLSAGGSYSFQVVATNAAGSSAPSAASAPRALSVTPSAPTGVTLAGGQGQVTASWAPVSAGGWDVAYEVELSDGQTQTTAGTSASFSVSPGSYVAAVRAVLASSGASQWAMSNAAGPWSPPGRPSVRQESGGVTVSWNSAGAGSGVIYTVNVSGNATTSVGAGSGSSAFVPLSPGSYSVTVTASQGGSSATSPSADVQVTGAPPAPSVPVIAAYGASGTLEIATPATAVAGNGWNANDLDVQYSVGRGWTSGTTLTGLRNGTEYTVYARTVASDGSVSASVTGNSATPYGPPGTPSVTCSPSGTSVSCSFTPADTGGRPVSYQQANSAAGDGATSVPAGGTGPLYDVGPGERATWCVRAFNDAGSSGWSCDSATANGVDIGTERSFQITTNTPEAACSEQDYQETGFFRGWCWRIVLDVSGFNPNSNVSCSYQYRDRQDGDLKSYTGTFTVNSGGGARHVFPHRSPNPDLGVTCTQQ